MGILSNEVNFDNLMNNLSNCCLTEDRCHECCKGKCLVGYAKESVQGSLKNGVTYVEDGFDNIPVLDTKLYENHRLVVAIADILKQCRSCKENHYSNCLINILRSCYEVALFGEPQEYEGSALTYLGNLKNINEENAKKIFTEYSSR